MAVTRENLYFSIVLEAARVVLNGFWNTGAGTFAMIEALVFQALFNVTRASAP